MSEEHKPRLSVTDLVKKRIAHDTDHTRLTKRQYLTRKALEGGADIWTAIESVATTAMEHPEWDMDEKKTRAEWESG